MCKNTATLREGKEKGTGVVGEVQENSLVEVAERWQNAEGQTRLKIVAKTSPGTAVAQPMSPGWASEIAGDGTVLFQEVDLGGGGRAGQAGGANKKAEDRSAFSRIKIAVGKTINTSVHTARPIIYYTFIPLLVWVGMNTEPKPE